MKEIEFNLLTEPWIRVRLRDNTVREVSLTEALVSAQDYVDLAGEMPTQNAAVLRLLLAVLFTVFSRVDAKGKPQPLAQSDDALERWSELWQLGHFACQIHIILRMEQCVRQRNFLHRIIWPTNPDPRLRQQVKFDLLHPFPPFGRSGRFHGHNKAPCPQDGRSGFRPVATPALRAAAETAATPQVRCGCPLPTPG